MTSSGLLTTHMIDVAGHAVCLARSGPRGGTPIVFLHGYPESLQIWHRVVPRVAAEHDCIALDWPGMGRSADTGGGATPKHQARRLLAILDALDLARVSLVALDMGAQAALTFAAHHHDRVERLVVMNSLVFGDLPTSWEIRVLRRYGLNLRILRWLPRVVFARATRTFLPRGTRLEPALGADLWAAFRRVAVRRFIVRMCAGYQGYLPRLPADYTSITAPTLVLWGEHDKHFPLAQGERLHATIPGSRWQVVRGGHHWMPLHAADAVADALLTFLG